jgi:NAD(P)-dependent dehydrogenase (short-subunit alcohol dehydrogenase family)
LLFAAEGADVVLGARRSVELEVLARTINQGIGRADFLAGDVKDEGYADALVDLACREFGGLDGAFNNAGIVGEMAPIPLMGIDNWSDVVAVNLTAAFLAAKAQIPAMSKRGSGSIVSPRPSWASAMAACQEWEPMRRPRPDWLAWCSH